MDAKTVGGGSHPHGCLGPHVAPLRPRRPRGAERPYPRRLPRLHRCRHRAVAPGAGVPVGRDGTRRDPDAARRRGRRCGGPFAAPAHAADGAGRPPAGHDQSSGTDERTQQGHPAVGGGTGRDLRHHRLRREYAAEAEERWGETDAWKQSQQRTAGFTKDDWIQIKAEGDALLESLGEAKRRGVEPGTSQANELAARHRASIERFYECGDDMHRCLAEMYLADERFTRYDDVEPGLAQFLHDMVVESLNF